MKTRKTLLIVSCGLCALGFRTASAEWHAGGAIGQAYVDERIGTVELDADSTAYRVFGGYAFSDHFGVEASYIDFGTLRDTVDVAGVPVAVSAEADGFSLAATGTLPLSESLSLRGKAGLLLWDGRSTVNGVSESDSGEQNGFAGVGLGYDLSETAGVFLDVDYYDLDGVEPLLVSIGFAFRF